MSLCLSLSLSLPISFLCVFLLSVTEANIIATTTLKIFQGMPLNYHWINHGLKLHVPANAMQLQTPSQILSIQAIQSDHLQLPENMELVSGVYSVVFPQGFSHPIDAEIQHCASLEHPHQLPSLTFVSAKSTQGALPYQFQLLLGGIFPANSCYGSIQLKHSCQAAIVSDGSTKTYRALTYYIPQRATTWLIHFIVIQDLDLYIQVCNVIIVNVFSHFILFYYIAVC